MNSIVPDADKKIHESIELKGLSVILVVFAVLGLLSVNPWSSAFAIFQLYVLLRSYWRKNSPPVILLLFLIPWLEISTGVLEANLRGESLDSMLNGSGESAYWIGAIGLFAVHLGFLPFFRKTALASNERLVIFARRLSLTKLIIAYFAIGPLTGIIASFIGRGSGLYQFVTYLNEISLVVLIVICLRQVMLKEINKTFVLFCIAVLLLSFYSFFSEWRLLLFALFIGFGNVQSLTRRLIIRILLLSFIFGNVIFLWQGIKPLYRAYLTGQDSLKGGLISQSVNRSRMDALGKFFELSQSFYAGELDDVETEQELDGEDLLYRTLRRVGYLEFLSIALNKVPSEINHEQGALLRSNLSFALIPRFLNPNKGVKNDGAKVEKYTGFMVSHASSFSLGHYVEYFIDFGRSGMMVVLLLYGIIGGLIYRTLMKQMEATYPLLSIGLVYVVLAQWGSFQNDAIFIYGLTFYGLICHGFLFRPIYGLLHKFVSVK